MSTLATDASLGGALSLYQNILTDHPLAQRPVKGWGGARLKDFCEPEGWVGLWMIKAEISARVLLGARLWDVAYQASDQAAEGVLPMDLGEAQMPPEVVASYAASDGHPQALTAGLRFALARQGLNQSLVQDGAYVAAKPLVMPGLGEGLGIGDFLPFPTEAECCHVHVYDFITRSALRLEAVRTRRLRDADLGASPSVSG